MTEATPWKGGLIAIANVGLGGVNSHTLLQANQKPKPNYESPSDDLPRLVLISGRTEEAINVIFEDVSTAAF